MHTSSVSQKPTQFGYYLGVFGVALVLIWLGIYKFTPTEAKLIEPLVVNHPAMSWLYNCLLYTSPSPRDRQKSRMPSSA